MKKFGALMLVASLVLLVTLWLSGKVMFQPGFFSDLSFSRGFYSLVKTIVVLTAYIAGFFAMLVITFVDIISSIIWKAEFPLLHLVYDKFFLAFSKGWYWDEFSGSCLFISGLILFLTSLVIVNFPDTRRNQRIVYDPTRFSAKTVV